MTDAELIRKVLAGRVNAFNTIVWRWEKSLYNFVLRYVGDQEEGRDICQKTFIRAYDNLSRLREPEKFSTWLYQIAVNICRDQLKKKKRHRLISLEGLQQDRNGNEEGLAVVERSGQTSPEAAAHNRDVGELIQRALQQIPENQRVVIIMKVYQGLKFTEIAEILKTSDNTAKSRMYYGLRALRQVFKKWNINEEMLRYEV